MTNDRDPYYLTTRLVRPLLGLLVLIDIFLGGVAVFWPRFYMQWVHPEVALSDPVYLVQRSGMIWLAYLAIQAIAFLRFKRTPEWVLIVAFLRLVEVPADIMYLFVGEPGLLGTVGLTFTPIFNFVVGLFLASWYFCCGKELARAKQELAGMPH